MTIHAQTRIDAAANPVREALARLLPPGYARREPLVWVLLSGGSIPDTLAAFGVDANATVIAALHRAIGHGADC